MRVGEYLQGLSGRPGLGIVHVAVTVLVVITRFLVVEILDRVKVFVIDVVTAGGTMVFVYLAVAEGIVTVEKGPVVETMVCVCVEVAVIVGVLVTLKVAVGVKVVVACGPTSRTRSLCQANGKPSSLLPITSIIQAPDCIWFFKMGQVDNLGSSAGVV